MHKTLFDELVESLNKHERKDFEAVCCIIDNKINDLYINIAVVADDPYLLYLIFTSLIRYTGINIHIVNPKESNQEVYRLLNTIHVDILIDTHYHSYDNFHNTIFIGPTEINSQDRYEPDSPMELDFTLFTYSPYPVKINKVSSDLFETLVHSLIMDLVVVPFIKNKDYGCIPIATDNPDYLLYFIALKLAGNKQKHSLPSKADVAFPLENKEQYLEHNSSTSLFIPKKEFVKLWEDKIISLLEYRIIFNSYLKRRWLVNLLIKRRLKKLFKGFNSVVIIGILDNAYMVEILNHLSFVKVYSIFPIDSALYYGPISTSLESIIPVVREYKTERFSAEGKTNKGQMHELYIRLQNEEDGVFFKVSDNKTKYQLKLKEIDNINGNVYGYLSEYFPLGNIKNVFANKEILIFPETLERVINSYPFIKECVLLTFMERTVLIVNPHSGVLDSNRLNYNMFHSIIEEMITTLNKELPDEYRIRGFVIDDTSLIEKDRNGEIVRYPYNRLKQTEWSGIDIT